MRGTKLIRFAGWMCAVAWVAALAGCPSKAKPPRRPPAAPQAAPDTPFHLNSFVPPTSRAEAAAFLHRIGATLSSHDLAPEKVASGGVDRLTLSGQSVTDEAVAALVLFPELRQLTIYGHGRPPSLSGSDVTDEGMRSLAALAELEDLRLESRFVKGDGLRYLTDLQKLKSVHIRSAALGDGDLRGLRSLSRVRSLGLHGRMVDFDLTHLRSLPELSYLAVTSPHVTDAGLEVLDDLPNLRGLLLNCPKAGDATLVRIGRSGRFTTLSLSRLSVTDEGLRSLGNLPAVKHFDLIQAGQVTDGGLEVFRDWPALESIHLDENPRITGRGLAHVPNPGAVRNLEIQGPVVDDAGLAPLEKFTGVHYLRLGTGIGPGWVVKNGTLSERPSRVTDAGLAHLKRFESQPCRITLTNVAITDAGLRRLAVVPGVANVTLIRTPEVTRAGVEAARAAGGARIEAPMLDREGPGTPAR